MDKETVFNEICLVDKKEISKHIIKAVEENKIKSVKTDCGTMILISI